MSNLTKTHLVVAYFDTCGQMDRWTHAMRWIGTLRHFAKDRSC